jgi:hypothetical protein
MKKLLLTLFVVALTGAMVSCGSDEGAEKDGQETADKKGDKKDAKDGEKACKKGDKCCKKKKACGADNQVCTSRKALEEALSDEDKATIAEARTKFQEVLGEDLCKKMACMHGHMCHTSSCCSKGEARCSKDSATCKKECKHKDGEKCTKECKKDGATCKKGEACKHGHGHADMMKMMEEVGADKIKEMHAALAPTMASLQAIADKHADHFEPMMKKHEGHMKHMEGKEAPAGMEEMMTPEHMKQMMITQYLLLDVSKCKDSCKKECTKKCEKKCEKKEEKTEE